MNRTEQENQTEELLAYYRLAYEKEKEKNTLLAAKLAEAREKAEDLDGRRQNRCEALCTG